MAPAPDLTSAKAGAEIQLKRNKTTKRQSTLVNIPMSTKKIVVKTKNDKQTDFKISESNDGFTVYKIEYGTFTNTLRRLGEADEFDDALEIAKSSVGGPIKCVDIKGW